MLGVEVLRPVVGRPLGAHVVTDSVGEDVIVVVEQLVLPFLCSIIQVVLKTTKCLWGRQGRR